MIRTLRYGAVAAGIAAAIFLAGCADKNATPAVKTQTTVADIEIDLTTAEGLGTAYIKLPLCRKGGPAVCSDADLAKRIKDTDNVAIAAVRKARQSNTQPDIAAASAAVAALTAIVPPPKTTNN